MSTRSSVTKHLQGDKTIWMNCKCPVGLSVAVCIFHTQTLSLIKTEQNSGGNRSVKKARLSCALSAKLNKLSTARFVLRADVHSHPLMTSLQNHESLLPYRERIPKASTVTCTHKTHAECFIV
jgi:hypothetical protein